MWAVSVVVWIYARCKDGQSVTWLVLGWRRREGTVEKCFSEYREPSLLGTVSLVLSDLNPESELVVTVRSLSVTVKGGCCLTCAVRHCIKVQLRDNLMLINYKYSYKHSKYMFPSPLQFVRYSALWRDGLHMKMLHRSTYVWITKMLRVSYSFT